jgi:biotin carboxylase
MKRLLMLGGADIQLTAIKTAKELGYYVITCDYLPDNPGHKISHEYHNVSTTNREAVLELAMQLKIDGISAYASDPAALTAAFVSEKMGIPGNPFNNVLRLSDKFEFRSVQKEINIPHPRFATVTSPDDVLKIIAELPHGGIIKPVDTSGSKGIYTIHRDRKETLDRKFLAAIIEEGLQYSRMKRLILEEYIPRKGNLMSGDFLIENGKILFHCFGDVHFNTALSGLTPRAISLPASKPADFLEKVKNQLQQLISHLEIKTGVFNADVIEDDLGNPVVIDIGARNGGNMFNDIIFYHSGVNLIELSMRQCVGESVSVQYNGEIKGYFAHNVIHSLQTGTLQSIEFSETIEPLIIYRSFNKKSGDQVHRFDNSSFRIGLILLHFKSFEQMHEILGNIYEHMLVKVAP